MRRKEISSISDQVTDRLREGVLQGRWRENMPGRLELARELGVNHKTVEVALKRLTLEGTLVEQGAGRRRKIVFQKRTSHQRKIKLSLLAYDKDAKTELLQTKLLSYLQELGFVADFATKSLFELGMDVKRVARFVEENPVDGWIVNSAKREIMEWFSNQPSPAIALFGRTRGIDIATIGTNKIPAMLSAVRQLVAFGHRRIVMLTHEERRKPYPAQFEKALLEELVTQGLPTGPYNLPDWEESPEGFHACLESLFKTTPPTAIIFGETRLYATAQHFLISRGIAVPRDVSLVNSDQEPLFDWCIPKVAHIHFDNDPVLKHTARWAKNVARGKKDTQQIYIEGKFIEGGTMGKAPG